MSWFETVFDAVKKVTKFANALTGPIIDPNCAALPYTGGIWDKPDKLTASASEENEDENENENEDQDSSGEGTSRSMASATRVTTRARISYELDRFKKNAMLMFVQVLSNPKSGCRVEDLTMQEVTELLTTFTNFRFEVDAHRDLTCSQIDSKCQEFFQRDFRKYGAVVVAVLSFDGTNGKLSALDGWFSESIILRHLTNDLNPSLLAKPKIYITEANRTGTIGFMGREYQHSLPIEEQYQDVLGLHIPALYYGNALRRPLLILCDNINQMGDSKDFVTIVKKTVKDATESYSLFQDIPIELSNTFSKEMILAKS